MNIQTNDEDIAEIWKPIPSLNNKYEASNIGRIRNAITKKVLKQFNSRNGYLILQVRPEKYKSKNIRVHQAIAEAFLGKRPDGYVVNHKDGKKHNNKIENLEYVTPSENNQHALDNGLRKPSDGRNAKRGESHYCSTITEEIVYQILKTHDETGYGCRRIAKIFNISRSVVNHILAGHSWKETVQKYYDKKEF